MVYKIERTPNLNIRSPHPGYTIKNVHKLAMTYFRFVFLYANKNIHNSETIFGFLKNYVGQTVSNQNHPDSASYLSSLLSISPVIKNLASGYQIFQYVCVSSEQKTFHYLRYSKPSVLPGILSFSSKLILVLLIKGLPLQVSLRVDFSNSHSPTFAVAGFRNNCELDYKSLFRIYIQILFKK